MTSLNTLRAYVPRDVWYWGFSLGGRFMSSLRVCVLKFEFEVPGDLFSGCDLSNL